MGVDRQRSEHERWWRRRQAAISPNGTAWASEAESRREAFPRGEIEAVDGPSAISAVRNRLKA